MKEEWLKSDYKERFKLRNTKLDSKTYSLEEVIKIVTQFQPIVTKEQVEDIITRELIPPYKHDEIKKVIYISDTDSDNNDSGLHKWIDKGWKVFIIKRYN